MTLRDHIHLDRLSPDPLEFLNGARGVLYELAAAFDIESHRLAAAGREEDSCTLASIARGLHDMGDDVRDHGVVELKRQIHNLSI
jgi:hypothetical protein